MGARRRDSSTSSLYEGTKERGNEGIRNVMVGLTRYPLVDETAAEVMASAVKKTGVIFIPDKKLQEMLKNATFTKAQ